MEVVSATVEALSILKEEMLSAPTEEVLSATVEVLCGVACFLVPSLVPVFLRVLCKGGTSRHLP